MTKHSLRFEPKASLYRESLERSLDVFETFRFEPWLSCLEIRVVLFMLLGLSYSLPQVFHLAVSCRFLRVFRMVSLRAVDLLS